MDAKRLGFPPSVEAGGVYSFNGFQLDVDALELRNPVGAAIALAPTAFELLLLLVRNRERVVSKEELVRMLWPDVVVNDNALAQCVWAARRALGDGGRVQDLIKNVRGRGYRFVGVVEGSSSPTIQAATPHARRLLGRDCELECLRLQAHDGSLHARSRYRNHRAERGIRSAHAVAHVLALRSLRDVRDRGAIRGIESSLRGARAHRVQRCSDDARLALGVLAPRHGVLQAGGPGARALLREDSRSI
jgi:DNA-binding winged helix-turn-helix (wHTH) protein